MVNKQSVSDIFRAYNSFLPSHKKTYAHSFLIFSVSMCPNVVSGVAVTSANALMVIIFLIKITALNISMVLT